MSGNLSELHKSFIHVLYNIHRSQRVHSAPYVHSNMMTAILDNLTKEKDGIEFIDKEKYVKLYEHHLKTKTLY